MKAICFLVFLSILVSACGSPAPGPTATTPVVSTPGSAGTPTASGEGLVETSGDSVACLQRVLPAIHTDPDSLAGRPAAAAWSPDGKSIAFLGTVTTEGDPGVQLLLAQRPNFDRLLVLASNASGAPVWSPDGSRLAFVSTREADQLQTVMVTQVDGRSIRDLFPGERGQALPGDGSKAIEGWLDPERLVVYTSCGTGCRQPVLVDLRDSSHAPLFDENMQAASYSWSPDRRWVVAAAGANPQLGLASGEGGDITWLSGQQSADPANRDFFTFAPSWAPDSARFAFLRQPADRSAPPELWIWDVAAGQGERLMEGVVSAAWSPQSETGIAVHTLGEPRYAEDGAWQGVDALPEGPNPLGLGAYDLSQKRLLFYLDLGSIDLGYTRPDRFSERLVPPIWSPDSWRLAYRDAAGLPWMLIIGFGRANLDNGDGLATGFAWSPDDAALAVKTTDHLAIYASPCGPQVR